MGGIQFFAAQLIDPSFALAALAVIASLGLWRIAAIGHAAVSATPSGGRLSPRVVLVVIILALAVIVPHGVAGYYAWAFFDAGSQIFQADGPAPTPSSAPGVVPSPSDRASEAASAGPSEDPGFEPPPTALPPPTADRVTFLLTGVDSGHDRDHALTDTLLVVEHRQGGQDRGHAQHSARHLGLPALLRRDVTTARSIR